MQARFSVHCNVMAPPPVPASPARILVRSVNWLGDAVMTTPALLRLREHFPASRITLLSPAKLATLWSPHPALDDVLTFAPDDGAWTVARRLRRLRFDLALLLPNSPRSGLEAFLARIPRRVGGAWPWRNWLLTDVVRPAPGLVKMRKRRPTEIATLLRSPNPPPHWGLPTPGPESHQLFHYLRLTTHLGANPAPLAPSLALPPAEIAAARERFGLKSSVRWIGLNPGAEYGPAKRWPIEYFTLVARALTNRVPGVRNPFGLVLFGGPADLGTVAEIITSLRNPAVPVVNLAGRTSLRELAAALAACSDLITNDTGPMHVAAAVGTRVIVPFGSTSPELTGPGLPGDPRHALLRSGAPCSPCFLRECPIDFRCLRDLGPEQVIGQLRMTNDQ